MPHRNEPIPLDNTIEILEVYIEKLTSVPSEDTDTLRKVLLWSHTYLCAYREGINSITPQKILNLHRAVSRPTVTCQDAPAFSIPSPAQNVDTGHRAP